MHDKTKRDPLESPRTDDLAALSYPSVNETGVMPLIEVPAKVVEPPKVVEPAKVLEPPPVSSAAPAPSPEVSETDASAEKSLEWRKKAVSRRLRANREGEERNPNGAPAGSDYAPQFVPRHHPDWTPAFDQSPSEPEPGTVNFGPDARPPFDPRWRWLLLAGTALAALLILVHVLLLLQQEDLEKARRELQRQSAGVSPGSAPDKSGPMPEIGPKVQALLERFFAATTVDEKLPLVRGGDALRPAMEAYYSTNPDEPPLLTVTRSVTIAKSDDREFVFARGSDTGQNEFDAAVEVEAGQLRIDWRYLTGAAEMPWQRWIDERPSRPVFHRVFAALDDYYAGDFGDSKSWVCFKTTDISYKSTVWAYVERGSDAGYSILRKLSGASQPVRLMLALEFSAPQEAAAGSNAAALAPQAIVRSIEETGWIDRSPEVIGPLNGEVK